MRNCPTIQLVLRHSFSAAAATDTATTAASGATTAGATAAGANGTAPVAASSGIPSRPHCVALHPDGHSVALGFASHTALYFITAACSTAAAAVGGTVVLSSATTAGNSTTATASAAATDGVDEQQQQSEVQLSELQLRADQEVLMCGVFRAPGEDESCLNSDPVGELIFRYLNFTILPTSTRTTCIALTRRLRSSQG
jgi:hypothetical protein